MRTSHGARRAKKRFDKPRGKASLASIMSQNGAKSISPASLLVDAIVVGTFFVFMFTILRGHVPSANPLWINFWGVAVAGCMSGVFWLAVQMFRVVLRAQRERDSRK